MSKTSLAIGVVLVALYVLFRPGTAYGDPFGNPTLPHYTGYPYGTTASGIPFEGYGQPAAPGSLSSVGAGSGLGSFFSALGQAFHLGTAVAAPGNAASSVGVASAAGDRPGDLGYQSALYDPLANVNQDQNAAIPTQGTFFVDPGTPPSIDVASPSVDISSLIGGGTSLDFPSGFDATNSPIPTTVNDSPASTPFGTGTIGIPTSADTGGLAPNV